MAHWSAHAERLATERYPALLAYATLLGGDRAAAEDLVHDALVKTFSRPRRLRSDHEAEAYVRRAILTIFLDRARGRSRLNRAFARIAERPVAEDASRDVVARDAVTAALSALSPRERACTVLRYYDDLPVAEVATRLGIAEGTCKRYLSDAAAKLRAELGDDGPAPSATEEDDSVVVADHSTSARRKR